jgi:hypothetical protein
MPAACYNPAQNNKQAAQGSGLLMYSALAGHRLAGLSRWPGIDLNKYFKK